MISRFYKQFSRNVSAMAPEQLFEKISNFKNMTVLYIILKQVVWRFRIYDYFREIFKFRDFMNTLRNFAKSVFAHIFAKLEYWKFENCVYYQVHIRIFRGWQTMSLVSKPSYNPPPKYFLELYVQTVTFFILFSHHSVLWLPSPLIVGKLDLVVSLACIILRSLSFDLSTYL